MHPRELADLQRMKHLKQPSRALVLGILTASTWTGSCLQAGLRRRIEAVSAFEAYAGKVESRLAQQHRSSAGFLADVGSEAAKQNDRLHRGEVVIEKLTPDNGEVPGGMLHHWRGTAFVSGATAADFGRLMKNFSTYPQMYSPQVLRAEIVSPQERPVPDHFSATMRVKQKHVITVVTGYDL